jgi:hypothetical protein
MNVITNIDCPLVLHNPPTIEDWIKVRDVINPAIKRLGGTHNEEDVLTMILAKRLQLWTVKKSAIITELVSYPRFLELSVFAAGGNLEDLLSTMSLLEAHAKEIGCARVRTDGRLGWERIKKHYPSYDIRGTILIKDL